MKFTLLSKKNLAIYGAVGIAVGLFVVAPNYAKAANQTPSITASSKPSMQELKAWRSFIEHAPLTKKGCFKAEYPQAEWRKVPCTDAPLWPYRPANSLGSNQISIGRGAAARVEGDIGEAVGSFDSVSVTSETGINPNTGLSEANIFSLQLNSNFLHETPACKGGHKDCKGWAQFVYSNTVGLTYIQYWLINYGKKCPKSGGPGATGWLQSKNDCYGNSKAVRIAGTAPLAISHLATMSLVGQATAQSDTLIFHVNDSAYTTHDKDSVVHLSNHWKQADFNIVGDADGTEATFASNSLLQVRIAVDHQSRKAPSCKEISSTGETNNLFFGEAPTNPNNGDKPALVFTESSTDNSYAACDHVSRVKNKR